MKVREADGNVTVNREVPIATYHKLSKSVGS